MACMTLNLSKAASIAFGALTGNTKVRVKEVDGVLMVLPTARKSGANLPKEESFRALTKRGPNSAKITVSSDKLTAGMTLVAQAAKNGWYALVPTQDAALDSNFIRVSKA